MKVLVLGCGSIGKRHIRNLRQLGITDLAAFDPAAERREEVSKDFAIKSYGVMEEALASRPDLCIVAAPNHLHMQIAETSLRQGCHLFVEKPISHSWENVERLLKEANRMKRIIAVGYQLRHHPGLQQAHRWLQDGRIGKILSGRIEVGQYLPDWHPWEDYRKGYSARQEMGGGAILDCSHELDLLLWLMGRPAKVWAAYGHVSQLQIDVEDIALIVARYPDGSFATVGLDYVSRPAARNGKIIGSEGTIEWDLARRTLRLFSSKTGVWQDCDSLMQVEGNDLYLNEQRDVIDSIRKNQSPFVDGSAGKDALRLALLARISGKEGREVSWNHGLS